MNPQSTDNVSAPTTGETAVEVQRFPDHFRARVDGNVQHRPGDGVLEDIPVGTEVQVDTALASYVLSWTDKDDHPMIVTLAKREFEFYVDEGAIVIALGVAG